MKSRSELILGGQRSGKSRPAELLAGNWLGEAPLGQLVCSWF
jgi:adenosylcobinamide kinase/adenosylcobinamide-phosphate guanylyltransferase